MELATFGAIMGFAIELEKQTALFYKTAARGALEETFINLAEDASKRAVGMERARREGITEMILEPITGIDSDAYRVELSTEAHETEWLKQAIALEETSHRFYLDAADRIPVKEVVRTCIRMARERKRRKAELEKLQI